MNAELKQHMAAEVAERIGTLAQQSYRELSELPHRSDVTMEFKDKSYYFTVWTEATADGRLAVGVFSELPGRWGASTTFQDGFLLSPSGTKEPMPMDMQVKHI